MKIQKSSYLSKFALSERCVWLLLIKGPDTFFKLRQKKRQQMRSNIPLQGSFYVQSLSVTPYVCVCVCVCLTASRLWLISAPSIRLCLSSSLVSDARSLPARSTNHILQAQTRWHIFFVWSFGTISEDLIDYTITLAEFYEESTKMFVHWDKATI